MMFALPVDRLVGILPVLCMYLVMDREGEREREELLGLIRRDV